MRARVLELYDVALLRGVVTPMAIGVVKDDIRRIISVAEDTHDESTDIIGGDVKWPYTLSPGQVVKDGCCITDVEIDKTLREIGVSDPRSIIDNPHYRFFVKFTADVKGSPMDAEAEFDVKLV